MKVNMTGKRKHVENIQKITKNGIREIKKVTDHQDSLPLCSAPVKYPDI